MARVEVTKDMSIDTAISLFKNKCRKEGLYEEWHERGYFRTKSEKRRDKWKENKRRKALKLR